MTTAQIVETSVTVNNCPIQGSDHLARVVQTLDSAIHRINRYPADSVIDLRNTYPLDSDLSGG